jgi:prepilin-type N-terminal cleavage/methylation domain-containing protein
MKKKSGFTLIEILLSIALLAIIFAISAPIYQSFQNRNDLNMTADTIVQSLRRAQILSQSSAGDTSSGVKIQAPSIIVFRGTSFATRDSSLDEVFPLPASITPSGINEVVFSVTFGQPSVTGNINLNSNINESKTITINAKGMFTY